MMFFNKKMLKLYNRMHDECGEKKISIDILELKKLFFPEFKRVNDCIIISSKTEVELEKNFDKALKFLGGRDVYEISGTEVLINSYFESNDISIYVILQITFMVIDSWNLQLKSIVPDEKICFIISCDNKRVTLRFHKLRSGNANWLAKDLESYKEPIGYIIY